jgi:hypothetical protein
VKLIFLHIIFYVLFYLLWSWRGCNKLALFYLLIAYIDENLFSMILLILSEEGECNSLQPD